ncbi:MAG: hypothetical protein AAB497_00865 [Patescibacteria group bacterium]
MNSGSLVSSSKGGRSLLSSNRALQGAFGRIESLSARGETGYSDSSGEEGGWDDGKHSDGYDDSSEHNDSST